MAPVPETEDFYTLLRVDFHATLAQIAKAYKRLALELHPDRNKAANATQAFQQLAKAYETLSDEGQRRAYDAIYPTIKRSRPSSHSTQSSRPPPTTTTQEEAKTTQGEAKTSQRGAAFDAAQLAALEKSKRDRAERWRVKRTPLESSEFELKRQLRRVTQEIKNLDDILAAEAELEAKKNSWSAWISTPLTKQVPESDYEKENKERARQERRIEKDMKERRMTAIQIALEQVRLKIRKGNEEVEAADLSDDLMIGIIRARIFERKKQERMYEEKSERDKREEIRRKEELRRQEEIRKEEERQREEGIRKQEEIRKEEERQREEGIRKQAEIRRQAEARRQAEIQKQEDIRRREELRRQEEIRIRDEFRREEELRRQRQEKLDKARREKLAKEKAEAEKLERAWAEKQRLEKQKAEREKAEKEAAEQRARDDAAKQARASRQKPKYKPYNLNHTTHHNPTGPYYNNASRATCLHGGWWGKIKEYATCPECDDNWAYLLECPGCSMRACPKCQADIRPRGWNGGRGWENAP